MTVKRFVTLMLLVGVLITSVAPAFAQDDFDIAPYMDGYFANLAEAGFGHLNPAEVAVALIENPDIFLLDVRGPSELAESGYIEGAVNVPVRELAQNLDQLPADLDQPMIVYCAKGTRGQVAAATLRIMGYTDVANMAGGFTLWAEEGNAIVTDEFVAPEAAGGYMFEAGLVAFVDDYLNNVLPSNWGQMSADDYAVQVLEQMPFQLDVRTQGELESDGFIPGSTLIPINDLYANIDQVPADMPVFVNCKSGWRGTLAMVPLQMLGYETVNLAGGQKAYEAAGYGVEGKPEAEAEVFSIDPYMEGYFANLAEAGFGHLNPAEVAVALVETPDIFLLDVRGPSELADSGYIEGAVNVPVRELAQNLDQLPADLDQPMIVYCAKGTRGQVAAATLRIMGYTDVANMAGGFTLWAEEGNAIVTDEFVAPEAAGGYMFEAGLVAFVDDYLNNVLPSNWGQMSADDYAVQVLEVMPFQLDVRTQGELESDGFIPGSTLIPINDLYANIDQVPAGDVFVNCKSGWRGTLAMVPLQMMGYDAVNLAGGQKAYEAAGYDVEGKPEAEAETFSIDPYMEGYFANLAEMGFGHLNPAEVAVALIDNPDIFLLDVRGPSELADSGYIEGAVNVPVRELAQHLDQLPADLDQPMIVYCAKGTRGQVAAATLRIMGYTDVGNMAGGFTLWAEEGNAIVTEEFVAPEAAGGYMFEAGLVAFVDDYLNNVLPSNWGQMSAEDYAVQVLEVMPFQLDVRTQGELESDGAIPGTTLIPINDLYANIDQVPAGDVYVNCKSGWRGTLAMVPLQMMGYDAINLAGGQKAWVAAGYEVEGGAPVEAVEVVLPEGEALAAEAVAPVAFEAVQNIASLAGFGTLADADFAAAMDGAFILDVREVGEYAEGFIPGAVNVPLREVITNLNVLPDFDAPILVYCKAGYRGAVAALALDALGYDNVYNLRGGIGAWTGELSNDAPMVASAAFPAVEADLWVAVNDYYMNLPAGWAIVGADDFALEMTESEIFIVDVREASEYDGGHIAGAVNWPTRSFGMYLEEAPEDMGTAIVVYGSGGHRTALAQHALSLAGYENVRGMAAGSAGWANAGYELVTE